MEFANRLAADLQRAGWRVWVAPDSIHPGERWVEAIGGGLDGSGVFVVASTPAAVGSGWVRKETNDAIALEVGGEVRLIPLEVEAVLHRRYGTATSASPSEALMRTDWPRRSSGISGARPSDTEMRRRGDTGEPPHIEIAPSALRLSGAQVQELMASLLDAYDESSLRQMVRFQLDEHLIRSPAATTCPT